jgi:phosphoesterase RecJ-like protein
VRVSLRSVGTVDVSEVAARFGGGGHAFAAGFIATDSIANVLADVRSAVAVERGSSS